jgi:hypothetical protein
MIFLIFPSHPWRNKNKHLAAFDQWSYIDLERFYCVGGCWDPRTQDCSDFDIDSQTL